MNKRILVLLLITAVLAACSSSNETTVRNAETIYGQALAAFNDKEFIEAQKYFDVIKLQYPASEYADDAQFYLAEISFNRKEYQLAAFNYNLLRRIYQRSSYGKDALYKTGLCYYKLAQPYDRDQEYTMKAIQTFSEFQAVYPTDSLFAVSTDYIVELRERLGYREYFVGLIYHKMRYYKAALIYYNFVIDDYSDTKTIEEAYIGKIEVLTEMRKFDDAKIVIDLFKKNFTESPNYNKIKRLETEIASAESEVLK